MKISKRIEQALKLLIYSGEEQKSEKWQAVNSPDSMHEICNLFFEMDMPHSIKELEEETDPDLPWAEDHFLERVNGLPLNPGKEYLNWPYYRKDLDDNRFRKNKKFSHSYMERYWPPPIKGIRYPMGDLNDIVEKLSGDPTTRQAYLSVWHPEDQSPGDRRLPCSLGYWFNIRGNEVSCTYHIRSCDVVRHFKNDIYMTVRLVQWICNKLKYNPGTLYMWIGSLHIFKSELWKIKK